MKRSQFAIATKRLLDSIEENVWHTQGGERRARQLRHDVLRFWRPATTVTSLSGFPERSGASAGYFAGSPSRQHVGRAKILSPGSWLRSKDSVLKVMNAINM